jgi:serine/threonine-protein kinase
MSTTTVTAEKLAQWAIDVNILTDQDLQGIWSEHGTRNVELEPFKQALVRRGLLTNYQLDRLLAGYKTGFFYGDYKVQYGVGAGTFARVFRATHVKSGDLFAVKVLRARYSRPGADDKRELFRREGELGAQLKHPNIVAIHEVVSQGPLNYIVMDFVEGQNLRDFFKVRGKFEPLEATRIIADVMAGLNYAFLKGVTHRDLKMSNVILSSEGEAKLLDFGLAGLEGGGDDGDAANPRTIDYAGLERATNVRKDDTRSDIFFVGCIYYQLMSGKPALAETRERSQRLSKSRFEAIKSIVDVLPTVPLALARVVMKSLELDPARRYQTPGEMLADLKLAAKRVAEAKDQSVDEDAVRLEGHDANGQAIKLMIVESDHKMQDVFRELFKKQGYRVLVTSDPDRLFQRLYDDIRAADVLLISSGQIGREALEAFNKLGQDNRTKNLPAVLLLGEPHAAWMKEAAGGPRRLVTKMPLKSRELRHAILAALKTS